jgi:glyoxylase-like metal-dependent hydrolase (beta-lactamase superfamily II)
MIRIERVLAPNPGTYTLEGTNTWIVGHGATIVIDPGPLDGSHLREVARTAGRVSHVLVTHAHEDHAEGAAAFAEMVGAPLAAVRVPGAEPLVDGAAFPLEGGSLVAVATPGHSADHMVFFEGSSRTLFTGDAVLGRGTSLIDPPDGDLVAYLASLERMQALQPRTIRPGHGPVVLDASAKLAEYVAHRAEREEQVLASLEGGERAVQEMVRSIYAGYPEEVWPLAARSVLAHLLKLETEGRVARSGHGAAQRWSQASPKSCARCGRPMTGPGSYCRRCMVAMLQGASAEPVAPASADQP